MAISDELPMTSAMTSCADWLNSTLAETKVERFGLSLWSQRKTNLKNEMTHCQTDRHVENNTSFRYRSWYA